MDSAKFSPRPKLALVSLGCSKNTVDSENLLGQFFRANFDLVAEPIGADAVIVNTCGFIQPAVEESRATIREMLGLKKGSDTPKVYAMGCYVSRGTENWQQGYEGLDGVFPLQDTKQILTTLQKDLQFDQAPRNVDRDFNRPVATTLPHTTYLKIAEGCSRTCTYCTIPDIRGPNVSRPVADLVAEARGLARRGAREIILIAQDTTAYGLDIYGEPALLRLLKELTQIPEVAWFRLFYAYPEYIDASLSNFLLENKKMVPYLDLPIQHSHADVLKRMCRGGTFNVYDSLFDHLRTGNPDFALRTTLITGFPGETDAEYNHMNHYVSTKRFDRLGVFKYIREPGTPADRLSGHVDEAIKTERYEALMLKQQQIHFEQNQAWVGRTIEAIIDGEQSPGHYLGRTYRDAPDIDAHIHIESRKTLKTGQMVSARVIDTSDYDLVGRL